MSSAIFLGTVSNKKELLIRGSTIVRRDSALVLTPNEILRQNGSINIMALMHPVHHSILKEQCLYPAEILQANTCLCVSPLRSDKDCLTKLSTPNVKDTSQFVCGEDSSL